jgi:hypothetical protein
MAAWCAMIDCSCSVLQIVSVIASFLTMLFGVSVVLSQADETLLLLRAGIVLLCEVGVGVFGYVALRSAQSGRYVWSWVWLLFGMSMEGVMVDQSRALTAMSGTSVTSTAVAMQVLFGGVFVMFGLTWHRAVNRVCTSVQYRRARLTAVQTVAAELQQTAPEFE